MVGTAIRELRVEHAAMAAGARDFTDVLNPDLGGGRLGVVRPGVLARRLLARLPRREVRGEDFITRLAALKPKLYVSSFPLQNALAAGEVSTTVFVTPQTLDLKAQGAPVDFRLTPGRSWNSPW